MNNIDFSIIIREWQGKTIRQREDGYISLTDMAKACGKEFRDWNRLDGTKQYLEALSRSVQIPTDLLVEINESKGTNDQRGTWGHRRVAIRFSQWLSPQFAVQVDEWVEEIITKGYVIRESITAKELKEAQETLEHLAELLVEQSKIRHTEHLGTIELIDRVTDNISKIEVPQTQITATEWLTGKLPDHTTKFKSRFHRSVADIYRMTYKRTPELQKVQVGIRSITTNVNCYYIPRDTPILEQAFETVISWCVDNGEIIAE